MLKNYILGTALFAGVCFASILPASAKNLSASVTDTKGKTVSGFMVSATAQSLKLAVNEKGQGITEIPMETVNQVTFNDIPEGWNEALQQYNSGDFVNAERGFTILAEELKEIAAIKNQYGALARFYQLQSLQKNGKLSQLATGLSGVRANPIALSDGYNAQLRRLIPWGLAGKEDWDGVVEFVGNFQEQSGDRPRPSFKAGIPRSQIVELAYLSGLAKLQKGNKDAGLEDLYRALTLNRGSDKVITTAALKEAMTQLTDAEGEALKREAFSLASFYRDSINKGVIEPNFQPLIDNAPAPIPVIAPRENEPAPAEGAEAAEPAPAEAEKAEAK